MKLIEIARDQRDTLNDGMAWVAIWGIKQKNYRLSWFAEDFHPIEVNDTCPVFEKEQLARLAEITALDENAILLNGYYHSWVGSSDEPLNATQIADGIKRHYEMEGGRLSDYLAGEQDEDEREYANGFDPELADLCDIECESELDFSYEEKMAGEIAEQIANAPEFEPDCDTLTIELPWNSCGDLTRASENLRKLVESKASLIKAALGEDGTGELAIEFTDNTVKFKWLKLGVQAENPGDGEAVTFGTIGDWHSVQTAWTEFLCHLVKFAKKAQRVTAKDGELSENPKFDFRVFLVKIGMTSAEFKVCRKTLLRNLDGSTAFKNAESEAKWKARYGNPQS